MKCVIVCTVAAAFLSVFMYAEDQPTLPSTQNERVVVFESSIAVIPTPKMPEVVFVDRHEPTQAGRVAMVITGMERLASTEHPWSLDVLLTRYGVKAVDLATLVVKYADMYNLDPFVLVAIAWEESRFNSHAHGDKRTNKETGKKRYRSFGLMQINLGSDGYVRGRPTMDECFIPGLALKWAARELARQRNYSAKVGKFDGKGRLFLHRYNSKNLKNSWDYELKIWRTADLARGSFPVGRSLIVAND